MNVDAWKQALTSSERLYGNEAAVVDNAVGCDSACCSWEVSPDGLLLLPRTSLEHCTVADVLYTLSINHSESTAAPNPVILVAEQRVSISTDVNQILTPVLFTFSVLLHWKSSMIENMRMNDNK